MRCTVDSVVSDSFDFFHFSSDLRESKTWLSTSPSHFEPDTVPTTRRP